MPILSKRRYFVYELVDPRDGAVFYVGKGSGKRPFEHMRAARHADFNNPRKTKRIREIITDGLEVEVRYVKKWLYETEAYRLERRQIAKYGISNLTNISRGQTSAQEKMVAECEDILSDLDRILFNFVVGALRLTASELDGVLQTAAELAKVLDDPEYWSADTIEIDPDGSAWLSGPFLDPIEMRPQ